MRHVLKIMAVFSLFCFTPAVAQVVPTTGGTTYLAVVGDASGGGVCAGASCVNATRGIPLSTYALSSDTNTQFAAVNSQLNAVNSQLANTHSQIIDLTGYTAAVAAQKDAVPNAGDSYAVRLNMATVNGVTAGGISVSAQLQEKMRLSVDYGTAGSQNVVSGGLNFSFN